MLEADQVGIEMLSHLVDAANRGVQVIVVYDDIGSSNIGID